MRAESGSIRLNSERRVVRTNTASAAAISTPVGPAPTKTKVSRSRCRLGSSSTVRLLEGLEDPVPEPQGVCQTL